MRGAIVVHEAISADARKKVVRPFASPRATAGEPRRTLCGLRRRSLSFPAPYNVRLGVHLAIDINFSGKICAPKVGDLLVTRISLSEFLE